MCIEGTLLSLHYAFSIPTPYCESYHDEPSRRSYDNTVKIK